jgi:hypothetical protein
MFDHEYIGNIHIHTRHSDGSRSTPEIAGDAGRSGLDFICVNDHDYMTPSLHLEEEGFYGKVLVFMGSEIGGRYHHYLAYDLQEMVKSDHATPQEVIDRVNGQGGFGFLAHPFEKGMPFVDRSLAYTWNDLSVSGFTGICIWNFSSRWKEQIKTPFHGLFLLAFKSQTLKGPSRKTLAYWDELCQSRRVAAVGGSDAHASLFKWGLLNFKPLSYEYLLTTINIHILLNKWMPLDFQEAKKEVYTAMREGRLFIAHDHLAPSKGFKFYFISDDGSDLVMGEEGAYQAGELVVELPEAGEIRLIKDGRLAATWVGREAMYRPTEKGVYRIEVYKRLFLFGWRPWIFSNPIYFR